MPGPEKEQILEVLRTVRAPDASRDLVSLERIQHVAVCDGNVALRIAVPGAGAPGQGQLRGAVEAALCTLPGVPHGPR